MSDHENCIGARLLLKDEDGGWAFRGEIYLAVLPRVGEHVSLYPGDDGIMVKVVSVVHPASIGLVDLYVVDVGTAEDHLQRLGSSENSLPLTTTERLILWNQYYALTKLYPDEAKFFAERCEILEQGFTLFYATQHIDPNEVSEEDCREVIGIMSMFRGLHDSYGKLADKSDIRVHDVEFEGFDGNEETALMVFVRFLVDTQGKFQELKAGTRDDFNSHMPRLDCYRRMHDQWERSSKKYELSKEDIIRIVAARNRFA